MRILPRRFSIKILSLFTLLGSSSFATAQTNGTWTGTASANWSATTSWLGGNVATAGGTANLTSDYGLQSGITITLDTAQTISQINYNTGYTYTIAGSLTNTLNMPASGGLTLNSINSLRSSPSLFFTTANEITAPITGTGNLVKIGPGNNSLNTATNTFTGSVNINEGTLFTRIGDVAFGNAANQINLNGGTLGVNTTAW
ncbi:MAG: hypothetical protein ACRCZF_10760, partial [Gemmataceae bacterium]